VPIWGKLADLFGRKRTLQVGLSIFLVGSLACGASPTMRLLVLSRGLQGLGAGSIFPIVQTIFGDLFPIEKRARLQALFSLTWGASSVLGPLAGGAILGVASWPWVFWVNLPAGLLGLTVLWLKYHERRDETHEMDLGLPGVFSLTIASTALLALVSRLGPTGWSWPMVGLLLAITIGAMWFFRWHERRAANPVLPTELFLRREVGPAILASGLFGAAFLIACDAVARTVMSPLELPVGVITALIGGPFFLWLLVRRA
jgi:MFS family permease